MDISNRLKALASMVTRGNVACDVGTDHGYLAIYLVKQGISPRVIAMDVAKGPLSKAKENIALYGVGEQVETRLSDGVSNLKKDEAQTVIIAGMGGILINSLLEKGADILSTMEEIILSPHTDVELVRRFLLEHGYSIATEEMLIDEEKYYNIFRAKADGTQRVSDSETYSECELRYGRHLLQAKNPALHQFLEQELAKKESIHASLAGVGTENASKRVTELQQEIQIIKEGLQYYEM